jgi:hypothetical protein
LVVERPYKDCGSWHAFGLKGLNTTAQGKASERSELATALGSQANKPSKP